MELTRVAVCTLLFTHSYIHSRDGDRMGQCPTDNRCRMKVGVDIDIKERERERETKAPTTQTNPNMRRGQCPDVRGERETNRQTDTVWGWGDVFIVLH